MNGHVYDYMHFLKNTVFCCYFIPFNTSSILPTNFLANIRDCLASASETIPTVSYTTWFRFVRILSKK